MRVFRLLLVFRWFLRFLPFSNIVRNARERKNFSKMSLRVGFAAYSIRRGNFFFGLCWNFFRAWEINELCRFDKFLYYLRNRVDKKESSDLDDKMHCVIEDNAKINSKVNCSKNYFNVLQPDRM